MDRDQIERYAAGASALSEAVRGLTDADLNAFPVPGTWSIRQIVIHVMDSDMVATHRIKRIVAEEKPLLIAPCDSAMVYDEAKLAELTADPKIDCLVWTFRNHPHANRNPNQYGWVKADETGRIQQVQCKKAFGPDVRHDPGVIGVFWFRKAKFFQEAAEGLIAQNRRVNNEFYADSAIEVLIEQGRSAHIFDVKRMVCFGVPPDVKTYEYWERYFRLAEYHPYGKEAVK
jgi:bifunctional N-acetylglucosamine-1-phosphate-uridyltransferase/glucosamine-1-phosphate-acetyltransferase GlmU-like protein